MALTMQRTVLCVGRGGGVECHTQEFCFCADGHLLDAGGEISMSYNTLIQEKY